MEELLLKKEQLEKEEKDILRKIKLCFEEFQSVGVLSEEIVELYTKCDKVIQERFEIEQEILTLIEQEKENSGK